MGLTLWPLFVNALRIVIWLEVRIAHAQLNHSISRLKNRRHSTHF
jgi:hypothetical protein